MESLKNPWIPCPKTQLVEEEQRQEKILEEVPEHTVVINFDSTNYKNPSAYLLVTLRNIIFLKLITN